MSKCSSAIWCLCGLENLFRYQDKRAETWADVLAFYEEIGCEMKTLAKVCELAHWSYEEMMGLPWKKMRCKADGCGYKADTRAKWLSDVKRWRDQPEDTLPERNLIHNRIHSRHNPYESPTYQIEPIDLSTDILHLVFINIFWTFMERTIITRLMDMKPEQREPAELYFRKIGVPINLVKSEDIKELKGCLTGRDAKVLVANASVHITELLHYAHAGQETAQAAMQAEEEAFGWAGDGDEAVDGDGDDALDEELKDARSWDALIGYVHSVRPFEHDTPEYWEERAVECFNASGPMLKEYKRLHPDAQAATCHVAMCIVPRQMQKRGDPMRRSADHGEAFGASIKDDVHNRTLRRKKALQATIHKRKDADGNVVKQWTQKALSVSRIVQVWRNIVVRNKLLECPHSDPFLQRQHFRVRETGYAAAAASVAGPKGVPLSVLQKVQDSRENA